MPNLTYYHVLSPRAPSTAPSKPSPRSKVPWLQGGANRPNNAAMGRGNVERAKVHHSSPGKSKVAVCQDRLHMPVHSPDCRVGHASWHHASMDCAEGGGAQRSEHILPSPDARRKHQTGLHCGPSPAEAAMLEKIAMLTEQQQHTRDQQQLSSKMIERLKRDSTGWRDKFVALSETEKQSLLQVHVLALKVAERDDWLRESLPHKQMLQEQTAHMRAEHERELVRLKTVMIAAHESEAAVHLRLKDKLARISAERQREEKALRDGMRVLEHECAQVRMSHQEAAANVAGMPALQQHLQQLQQDLQQSQALNTALKVCEEYNVHMRTELRDLHVRLPRAEAALQEMQGERDVCLEDKRKSDEAQQSLVRSLELIQQQHEQSDVSSRQEKQEQEAQFMRERNFSSQQIVELQGEVTTCRDATTRVQTLLEEARQRGEEEKRASVVALEKLRNEAALAKQHWMVEAAKAKEHTKREHDKLHANLVDSTKSLLESQQLQHGLQRDLHVAQSRAAQGDEAMALMSRERDALRSQVRYLEERAREFARSVAVVQEEMARVVEGTAQTLGVSAHEVQRVCTELAAAERERDMLSSKVKELLDEDALAATVRRCGELHWQLDQALQRAGHIDDQRQRVITGFEAALARSGHEMQDLIAQVASWKGAHAASVHMMEQSCQAFAAHSAKVVRDKDDARAATIALEATITALRAQLAMQAGKMKGAESALELVHDTHFNTDSLMEGTLEHLHKKCRGFEAQLGQMHKVEWEAKKRAAEAERAALHQKLVHSQEVARLQAQVEEMRSSVDRMRSSVTRVDQAACQPW